MRTELTLTRDSFDAVIFDLDGVITSTENLHARAWKDTFDELRNRLVKSGEAGFEPFCIDPDYYRYVDGKPRHDGVASFLAARDVDLPHGDPDDAPDALTICGLGNRKNLEFLQLLEHETPAAYPSSIALIRNLRQAGFGVAVVSSSRNCVSILRSVGALDLFDVNVDGEQSEHLGLAGKPAPDIFLRAASALGVEPARAVVVEDAIAGVRAGRAGRFGLVIGVNRGNQAAELYDSGADFVVADLEELAVEGCCTPPPSALENIGQIIERFQGHPPIVLLDYDGTLTPIAQRPELACLSGASKAVLAKLAAIYPTAIVSGRDLDDVRALVDVDRILFAGSHGFDIALPDGSRFSPDGAEDALPKLERAEAELRERLAALPGVLVERKRFGIAVHYRLAAEENLIVIEQTVDSVLATAPGLRKRGGKKIFELIPDQPWDKGTTIKWLLQNMDGANLNAIPIFIGDDLTDEDAFRVLESQGIGIAVMEQARPTRASFSLRDPEEVYTFLSQLIGDTGSE